MTSPSERVELRCPSCGHIFETWFRPSINRDLDPALADEAYLHECAHATCPGCGTEFRIGPQVVVSGGRWEFR